MWCSGLRVSAAGFDQLANGPVEVGAGDLQRPGSRWRTIAFVRLVAFQSLGGHERRLSEQLDNEGRARPFGAVQQRFDVGAGQFQSGGEPREQPPPALQVGQRKLDRLIDPAWPRGQGRLKDLRAIARQQENDFGLRAIDG